MLNTVELVEEPYDRPLALVGELHDEYNKICSELTKTRTDMDMSKNARSVCWIAFEDLCLSTEECVLDAGVSDHLLE